MTYLNVPASSLVLVCDGSKAVFYKNTGTALAISLGAISTLEEHHPPNRELGSERPSRVVDSMDGSHSAVKETDWQQVAEEGFLHSVASRLDELITSHRTSVLILIAPPRALGVLRERLSDAVKRVEKAEIAKDLVKTPKSRLEEYLQSLGSRS
jgi:protein required for attachment to host cells